MTLVSDVYLFIKIVRIYAPLYLYRKVQIEVK
ncbi:hypothetical protein HMPREF0669_02035 [Prevotella sp. oral taxon 299 str. F0039]|nr:hypothetical protein HMPREF0669_02035 [Prevotella sp. oral taxon 299 str. F0039]